MKLSQTAFAALIASWSTGTAYSQLVSAPTRLRIRLKQKQEETVRRARKARAVSNDVKGTMRIPIDWEQEHVGNNTVLTPLSMSMSLSMSLPSEKDSSNNGAPSKDPEYDSWNGDQGAFSFSLPLSLSMSMPSSNFAGVPQGATTHGPRSKASKNPAIDPGFVDDDLIFIPDYSSWNSEKGGSMSLPLSSSMSMDMSMPISMSLPSNPADESDNDDLIVIPDYSSWNDANAFSMALSLSMSVPSDIAAGTATHRPESKASKNPAIDPGFVDDDLIFVPESSSMSMDTSMSLQSSTEESGDDDLEMSMSLPSQSMPSTGLQSEDADDATNVITTAAPAITVSATTVSATTVPSTTVQSTAAATAPPNTESTTEASGTKLPIATTEQPSGELLSQDKDTVSDVEPEQADQAIKAKAAKIAKLNAKLNKLEGSNDTTPLVAVGKPTRRRLLAVEGNGNRALQEIGRKAGKESPEEEAVEASTLIEDPAPPRIEQEFGNLLEDLRDQSFSFSFSLSMSMSMPELDMIIFPEDNSFGQGFDGNDFIINKPIAQNEEEDTSLNQFSFTLPDDVPNGSLPTYTPTYTSSTSPPSATSPAVFNSPTYNPSASSLNLSAKSQKEDPSLVGTPSASSLNNIASPTYKPSALAAKSQKGELAPEAVADKTATPGLGSKPGKQPLVEPEGTVANNEGQSSLFAKAPKSPK